MVHQFGPFEYDSEQRLLLRAGETVPLVPKALDTLHVLLDRRGQIIEKADLIKLVWPDTAVEEVGLARNISLLRKALGEEGPESSYIETIPRRGYRFAAATPLPPPRPIRAKLAAAIALVLALAGLIYWQFYVPSRFLRSHPYTAALAIIPFEPVTSPAADSLTDSLVSAVSKLDGVEVVSPSTVRRHQRAGISMGLMGRLLRLDVLVEGSVRQIDGRQLVTARLVDVHTGRVIWSDTYDHPIGDPGGVESQMAAQIGAHLAIHGEFTGKR